MTTARDGGAVFPTAEGWPGMSFRQYLAAHAPAVPDWYAVNVDFPAVPEQSDLTLDEHRVLRDMLCGDLPEDYLDRPVPDDGRRERLKQAFAARKAFCVTLAAAQSRACEERVYRWPWHYADMVLARQDAEPPDAERVKAGPETRCDACMGQRCDLCDRDDCTCPCAGQQSRRRGFATDPSAEDLR